jgi:hypothetical protein
MEQPRVEESGTEYYILGTGTWRDFLPRLPKPVFALGAKELYRALVHGDGFALPVDGGRSVVGFYTNRFVAAATPQEARRLAITSVQSEWKHRGYEKRAGQVALTVEELHVLSERFRYRSGSGFTFYSQSAEGDGGPEIVA